MDINWTNIFDVYSLLKCFIVAGIICVIGQILIDKTKLTPAKILVIFVTTGAILGGLGIYKYLVEFAGCGATVPLTGFGYNLSKGAIELVQLCKFAWCIYWWCKSCRWRYCCCCVFRLSCFFNF